MARPELGEKRRCLSCETKFYDLNKDPAVCPKCGEVFELQVPEKIVPVVEPVASKKPDDDDVTVLSTDPDTISLEDADDDDGDTVDGEDIPADIPEIAVDDEETNSDVDDVFLDEDEENGDMSGLVIVTKDDGDEN